MRLCLVRHGETAWNREGRLLGWTDLPLSVEGRQQVEAMAPRLRTRHFDRVWSSDLVRAVSTARILVDVEPTVDERLREIDFGSLEGLRWDDLAPAHQAALVEFAGFTAPGGESMETFRRRVLEVVADMSEGDHLVVTHGGVIRLLTRMFGEPATPQPGGVTELVI